jgi:hypothetical protein
MQRDHRRMQQNSLCNEHRVVSEPAEKYVVSQRHCLMFEMCWAVTVFLF